MEFNWVNARLAVGSGVTTVEDVGILVAAGITHCIDCRAEAVLALFDRRPEITCLFLGVNDDGLPKSTEWFQQGIKFALGVLSRPRTKLYVYCGAGVSRGPSMCYAILRAMGFDRSTAEDMIRVVRPQVTITYKVYADGAIAALGYE